MATLAHSPEFSPVRIQIVAAFGSVAVSSEQSLPASSPPALKLPSGEEVVGEDAIIKRLGHLSEVPGFYGSDDASSAEMDEWMQFASKFYIGAEFEKALAHLNSFLESRTVLVGNELGIGDSVIWAALSAAGRRWESLRKSAKYPRVTIWYNFALQTHPSLTELVPSPKYAAPSSGGKAPPAKKDGEAKLAKSGKAASKGEQVEGSFDVDLPDAKEGQVCTRFPPEPSGYLHIGHAKAAFLNQFFAQKYKGRLIIRFDDTNPSKEKDEFIESILEDLKTLGIKGDALTYTSDYFDELQEMAEKLIHEGKAYVDDTPLEQMRKERMECIESHRRSQSVEENFALWKEMLKGSEVGLTCCLRAKMDMQATNGSLRDPVYYRCNPTPHHRVGSKYKVYPTYDFACPYVDSKEGVTHALRSSEYHDRNDQFYKVLEDMGMRKVHVWDFSRLNMVNTLLSKRKLQWFVDNGKVDGWDDPRFPTVRGIQRHGLTVEALKQFILSQGASKNLNLMEWDKLWTVNKKIIDPTCARHTALFTDGKVLLELGNGPDAPFVRIIPRHKKYEGAGKKATYFSKRIWLEQADARAISPGEEVTLMDWGNAIVKKIDKDENGNVTALSGDLHLEGSVKSTKLKLTWLAESSELVPLSLVQLDHMITKKKLEEGEDFLSVVNPKTRWEDAAVGDSNMRNLKKGEIIQLERKGYFICDVPYFRASKPITLISIPDGRVAK